MHRSLICATGAFGVALAATVLGQQAVSGPVVHTVRVDAVVVDARGTAISDLTRADFEVREDGQSMAVGEARFIGPATGGGPQDAPQAVGSEADEEREARRSGARLVAIYLDEYHITPGAGADRAREALTSFIDRTMGPRDLLVVMKPLDSLFTIRLTHDRDEARRLVAGLEGRRGDYTPRTAYERTFMVGVPARVEAARTQVTVSALNALALHMGGLNDLRKTLLVVTEGLTRPQRHRGQEYLATIDAVLRSANRANVSIYPIDPRPAPAAEGATEAELAVLNSLANDTDGQRVTDAADLGAAVRDAVVAANGYYLLTYQAPHKEDGAFHPVQVSVKRAGARLHARSGFWAPSLDDRLKADLLARANIPPPPIKYEPARHISPLIQPWFGVSLGRDRTTRVSFVWEPAVSLPGERGQRRAPGRVELTVLGDSDAPLFEGVVLPSGPGLVEDRTSAPSRVTFDVPPGRLRLRMKILDAARRDLDADVRDLVIRDLRTEVSIGTPEVLRARNAREYRAISADPTAVPVAARAFSRTERLLVRFHAYAPNGQPEIAARLLNRMGQPMRTLDVRPMDDGGYELDLELAALASGDYQFEFTATAPAGRTKETIAFRVTS